MKNIAKHNQSGFTLIELLIVIIILGILIAIGIISFASSIRKTHDVKRKNDLRQIAVALESYYNDKGRYPTSNANGELVGCAPDDLTACTWGAVFSDKNDTIYMALLPGDSDTTQQYMYASADGTSYQLYARLENTLDGDIPKDAQNKARAFSDMICGSAGSAVYCNYGVASTNTQVTAGRTITYE